MAHQFLLHLERSSSLVKQTPESVPECANRCDQCRKRDISNELSKGTFVKSFDTIILGVDIL